MPFIDVKVAGRPLEPQQVAHLQKGVTALMAEVLGKVGPLVGVLVEQVPLAAWSVGGEPVRRVAQVDAIVSAGTNTPEQKARFIAETAQLLRSVLGPELSEICYVVVHEVPKDSWGYDGLTQARRAQEAARR
ncbi:tautomerase family protein [Burkholderia plantarii]|uniref:4-oxalocrotonate tautomerase n=1 Tax=Burkholderia plantarii TaxID=41899 RepID=A0A0B6RY02_BURPL|nr:tautomerase family protein [Burkholderia plantarii]AJK45935.1 4-oxalocrotonate tautomerase [Burkholderia plantarii]